MVHLGLITLTYIRAEISDSDRVTNMILSYMVCEPLVQRHSIMLHVTTTCIISVVHTCMYIDLTYIIAM